MPLKFRCPKCSKKLAIPESLGGKKIRCPKCESALRAPAAPDADEPPANLPAAASHEEEPASGAPDPSSVPNMPLIAGTTFGLAADAAADDAEDAGDAAESPAAPTPTEASDVAENDPPAPPVTPEVESPEVDPAFMQSQADGFRLEEALLDEAEPEVAEEFMQSQADGFRLEEALLDEAEPEVAAEFMQTRADGFTLEDAVFDDPDAPAGQPNLGDSDLIALATGATSERAEESSTVRRKLEALKVYDDAVEVRPEDEKLVLTSRLAAEEDDLDMTPMVDVTFLLLIFFMITASFTIQKSMPAQPPQPEQQAAAAALEPDEPEEEPILVEVFADNSISVEGTKVPLGAPLVDALSRQRLSERRTSVMIELEPEATHGTVVGVTDAAVQAGMESIKRSTR